MYTPPMTTLQTPYVLYEAEAGYIMDTLHEYIANSCKGDGYPNQHL